MYDSLDEFFFVVCSDIRFSLTVGSLMYLTDPEDTRRRQLEETFEAAYLEGVREQNRGIPVVEMNEHIGRALDEINRFLPRTVHALRRFYRARLVDEHLMPPLNRNAAVGTPSSETFEFSSETFNEDSWEYGSWRSVSDDEDEPGRFVRVEPVEPEARKRLKRKQTSEKPAQLTMKVKSARRLFKEDADSELAKKRRRLDDKPVFKRETDEAESSSSMVLRSGLKLKRKLGADFIKTSPEVRKKVAKIELQELEYDSDQSDDGVSEEAFRRLDERITDPAAEAKRFMKIVNRKSVPLRPEASSSSESQGGRYPERWNRAGFPLKRSSRLSRIDLASMNEEDMPHVRNSNRELGVPEFLAEDDSNQPSTSGPYRIPVSDDDEPETRNRTNKPSTSDPTHQPEEDEDEEMESEH